MKITKNAIETASEQLQISNEICAVNLLIELFEREDGINEEIVVLPFTIDDAMQILKATKHAYDILTELLKEVDTQ